MIGRAAIALLVASCVASSSSAATDAGIDAARPDAARDVTERPPPCVPAQPGVPSDARVPPPYAGRTNPLGASAEADGVRLYPIWCARCHGLDARGGGAFDPPASDLTASALRDDYVFWRIAEGGRGDPICSQMPSFASSLSEDERWQLVAFVHSIEPEAGAPDAGGDAP